MARIRERLRVPPALLLALVVAPACAPTLRTVQRETGGVLVATAGSNQSVIFVAPVAGGVLLIDLGWRDAAVELSRSLERLGRSPEDVVATFLTHAHRDHIAAWALVSHAPIYLSADEVDLFLGRVSPAGTLPELGDRLLPARHPDPGEVVLRPFSGDTVMTIGGDTVRAFTVPGHTAGSAAYLFRDVLFVGDALAAGPFGGLRPAVGVYSEDPARARESARLLLDRSARFTPRFVCTAHGVCVPWKEALRAVR